MRGPAASLVWKAVAGCAVFAAARADSRFFRREDRTAYGFGLFSQNMTFEDYGSMFHGDDERIDTASLALSTELWEVVAADLLNRRD